jgi:hypothetical protein
MASLRFRPCCWPSFVGLAGVLRAESPSPVRPVFEQRALKIAGTLGLSDPAQTARVSAVIARQYEDLSRIHARRDEQIQAAKGTPGIDKATQEARVAAARAEALAAQNTLHPVYLARLAAELSPAQIDQVKDGMTYGVLPLTFRVYQEMLPNLTAEQKQQILAWLVEARELAMDASTSEEKHGWFGKYKGRINNYLAAAGIDMKQAERELAARRKSATTK